MNIRDLCIVFGPTIVRDAGGGVFRHGNKVIDPLLKNVCVCMCVCVCVCVCVCTHACVVYVCCVACV